MNDKEIKMTKYALALKKYCESFELGDCKSCIFVSGNFNCKLRQTPNNYDIENFELSEDEKAILRNIPKGYQYIVRNKNGTIIIWNSEPIKTGEYWCASEIEQDDSIDFIDFSVFDFLFQFITWEDEEPIKIDDLVKRV